jgi:hypothetical protein
MDAQRRLALAGGARLAPASPRCPSDVARPLLIRAPSIGKRDWCRHKSAGGMSHEGWRRHLLTRVQPRRSELNRRSCVSYRTHPCRAMIDLIDGRDLAENKFSVS